MYEKEYRERFGLFPQTLKVLSQADKWNLVAPLTARMDRWAGAKVARFNTLCQKLIARYGGK